jgi:hypothetical protein
MTGDRGEPEVGTAGGEQKSCARGAGQYVVVDSDRWQARPDHPRRWSGPAPLSRRGPSWSTRTHEPRLVGVNDGLGAVPHPKLGQD